MREWPRFEGSAAAGRSHGWWLQCWGWSPPASSTFAQPSQLLTRGPFPEPRRLSRQGNRFSSTSASVMLNTAPCRCSAQPISPIGLRRYISPPMAAERGGPSPDAHIQSGASPSSVSAGCLLRKPQAAGRPSSPVKTMGALGSRWLSTRASSPATGGQYSWGQMAGGSTGSRLRPVRSRDRLLRSGTPLTVAGPGLGWRRQGFPALRTLIGSGWWTSATASWR